MTIVNDDTSIASKLSSKLINDARVIIYNPNMFIIKATGLKYPIFAMLCKLWCYKL
jgi:hypothetical protein